MENINVFVFPLVSFRFGVGGKSETLITKISPDLNLTIILAKKLLFSTEFIQKVDKHSSSIVLATVVASKDGFVF